MNDKELADKVVILLPDLFDTIFRGLSEVWPEAIVRDWRVAGVLMEVLFQQDNFSFASTLKLWSALVSAMFALHEDNDESMPRAIIEACVEELEPVLDSLAQKE